MQTNHVTITISVSFDPLNLETVEGKGRKLQKIQYFENE